MHIPTRMLHEFRFHSRLQPDTSLMERVLLVHAFEQSRAKDHVRSILFAHATRSRNPEAYSLDDAALKRTP